VSMEGMGGSRGVFLVDGAIVQYKREYDKNEEKWNLTLESVIGMII
jgi:hypothetical protein